MVSTVQGQNHSVAHSQKKSPVSLRGGAISAAVAPRLDAQDKLPALAPPSVAKTPQGAGPGVTRYRTPKDCKRIISDINLGWMAPDTFCAVERQLIGVRRYRDLVQTYETIMACAAGVGKVSRLKLSVVELLREARHNHDTLLPSTIEKTATCLAEHDEIAVPTAYKKMTALLLTLENLALAAEVLQVGPQTFDLTALLVHILRNLQRFEEGLVALARLRQYPEVDLDADFYELEGDLFAGSGQHVAARTAFAQAARLAAVEMHLRLFLKTAREAAHAGDNRPAHRLMPAIFRRPNLPLELWRLAAEVVQVSEHPPDKVAFCCLQVVADEPKNFRVQKALSQAFLQMEKFADAIPSLRACITLRPDDKSCRTNMYIALEGLAAQSGDTQIIIDASRALLQIEPRNAAILCRLARALTESNVSAALPVCRQFFQLPFTNAQDYLEMVCVLERCGKFIEANKALRSVAKKFPDDLKLGRRFARSCLFTCRYLADGVAAAMRVAACEPHQASHQLLLATLYRARGEKYFLDAVHASLAAIRLRDGFVEAWLLLAESCVDRLTQAAAEVIGLTSRSQEFADRLAEIRESLNGPVETASATPLTVLKNFALERLRDCGLTQEVKNLRALPSFPDLQRAAFSNSTAEKAIAASLLRDGKSIDGHVLGRAYNGLFVFESSAGQQYWAQENEFAVPPKLPCRIRWEALPSAARYTPSGEIYTQLQRVLRTPVCNEHRAEEYAEALVAHGYEFAVGGGILRDILSRIPLPEDAMQIDFDALSSAPPMTMRRIVKQVAPEVDQGGIESSFDLIYRGAISIRGDKPEFAKQRGIDFVSMRVSGMFAPPVTLDNGLHQDATVFAGEPLEDALARGYTVNAMFYLLAENLILDPTGFGVHDSRKKIIRFASFDDKYVLANHMLVFLAAKLVQRGFFKVEGLTRKGLQENAAKFLPNKELVVKNAIRLAPRGLLTRADRAAWFACLVDSVRFLGLEQAAVQWIAPCEEQFLARYGSSK